MKRSTIITLVCGTLLLCGVLPLFAFADTSGLIPCGNTEAGGQVKDQCTYEDFIKLIQTVIDFLIFKLAAPISAIMFAYAGFLYLTNGGNESKIKQAHDIFLTVFWGFVIALGAWLIVKLILDTLIGTASPSNFLGT